MCISHLYYPCYEIIFLYLIDLNVFIISYVTGFIFLVKRLAFIFISLCIWIHSLYLTPGNCHLLSVEIKKKKNHVILVYSQLGLTSKLPFWALQIHVVASQLMQNVRCHKDFFQRFFLISHTPGFFISILRIFSL